MNIRHSANNAGCCFQHHKFIIPGMRDQHSSAGAPPMLGIPRTRAYRCRNSLYPGAHGRWARKCDLGVERLQRGTPRVHLLPSFECSRLSQCQTQPQWLVAQEWLLKRCLRMPRTLTRCRATGCGLQKTLVQVITCYNYNHPPGRRFVSNRSFI